MIDFTTGVVTTDDRLVFGRGTPRPALLALLGDRARTDSIDRFHQVHADVVIDGAAFAMTVRHENDLAKRLRLILTGTGFVGVTDARNVEARTKLDALHRDFLKRAYGASLPKSKSFNWGQVIRTIDLEGPVIELRFFALLRG